MSSEQKKPKTVGDLVFEKYQEDAQKALDRVDLRPITSLAKAMQPAFDSMKKHMEEAQKMRETYTRLTTPVFDMPELIIPRNPQYDILDELRQIKEQGEKRKKEVGIFIFDEKNKTLTRDTETRTFEYKFTEKGMNFELVKILVDRDGFRQTRHLKEDIKSKSNEAVRKKVGEINDKVKNGLRLEDDFKFIVGEPGAGYKINSDIKIKVIEA